ncbi:unnamed protein product, partial [Staurois parvus]
MLTPSCPVPLVQCHVFFFALITVLVSLGMSVTPSQYPPMSECPPQSRHKSLIVAIISIKKKKNLKIPVSFPLFVKRYNFHVNQLI